MAQIEQVKPTKNGFEVRRVANGLMLSPPTYHQDGRYRSDSEIYVFNDMTALAAWLLAEEARAA